MAETRLPNVTIENAHMTFRNFSGLEGAYNRKGDRNFCIFLDPETAEAMKADGWNVKQLKPREEGDIPQDYIQVKVKFGDRPPRIVMITSRGRTTLSENEVNILDWAEIENADVILNPYHWDWNGKEGITAYAQSVFITVREDELERKYANVPDTAQNCVGDECDLPQFQGMLR